MYIHVHGHSDLDCSQNHSLVGFIQVWLEAPRSIQQIISLRLAFFIRWSRWISHKFSPWFQSALQYMYIPCIDQCTNVYTCIICIYVHPHTFNVQFNAKLNMEQTNFPIINANPLQPISHTCIYMNTVNPLTIYLPYVNIHVYNYNPLQSP